MKYLFVILFFILSNLVHAQISLTEFNFRFKEQPKIIMLYFYTDWCNVCKIQEKQIHSNPKIQAFLKNEVYYIKINGESSESINFLDQTYIPSLDQKTHPFATIFIHKNDITYPMWIILDQNLKIIDQYSGLIKSNTFELLIDQIKKSNH